VKLDKSRLAGREVRDVIKEILLSQFYLKQLVCFDPDVELRSVQRTQWAVATRAQIDRDLVVIPDQPGTGFDPSERDGKTTKWGLDATAKPDLERYAPRNRVPEQVLARIDLRDLLGH
jgi:UbiD family decarboxylase